MSSAALVVNLPTFQLFVLCAYVHIYVCIYIYKHLFVNDSSKITRINILAIIYLNS